MSKSKCHDMFSPTKRLTRTVGRMRHEHHDNCEDLDCKYCKDVTQFVPDCVLVKIFHLISAKELLHNVRHVCKRWENVCMDLYVWKDKAVRCGPSRSCDLRLDNNDLIELVQYTPYVDSLLVSACKTKSLRVKGLMKVFSYCPNLKRLCMPVFALTPKDAYVPRNTAILDALAESCPELVSMHVPGANFDGVCYTSLAKLVKLQELIIEFAFCMTDEALVAIARNCKDLRHLELWYCFDITVASLDEIWKSLLKLTTLKLFLHSINTSEGVSKISNLHNLQTLELKYINAVLNFSCLFKIANGCSKLQNISLRTDIEVSIEGFAYVCKHLQSLKMLSLYGDAFTDDHIKAIGHSRSIQKVFLSYSHEITTAGIEHLVARASNSLRLVSLLATAVSMVKMILLANRIPGLQIKHHSPNSIP